MSLRVLLQHKDAVLKAHANVAVWGEGALHGPSRCATPGQRLIITPSEVRRRRFVHSSKQNRYESAELEFHLHLCSTSAGEGNGLDVECAPLFANISHPGEERANSGVRRRAASLEHGSANSVTPPSTR